MFENDKKRQHYVWRHYLQPWTNSDQVWCKRDGKIFQSSLMGIAQERYFYKVERLNKFESESIDKLIRSYSPFNYMVHKSIVDLYDVIAGGDAKIARNGFEEYHTEIELLGMNSLKLLYTKDLSFYWCSIYSYKKRSKKYS